MKWRNSKERELLAAGGSREQTLPNKNNPHPDLSDAERDRPKLDLSDVQVRFVLNYSWQQCNIIFIFIGHLASQLPSRQTADKPRLGGNRSPPSSPADVTKLSRLDIRRHGLWQLEWQRRRDKRHVIVQRRRQRNKYETLWWFLNIVYTRILLFM